MLSKRVGKSKEYFRAKNLIFREISSLFGDYFIKHDSLKSNLR